MFFDVTLCLLINVIPEEGVKPKRWIKHVCDTRNFVMAIIHWKQGLLCDKSYNEKCIFNTYNYRR